MSGNSRAYSTTEFTDAVISNLGRRLGNATARTSKALRLPSESREVARVAVSSRHVVGVDVYIETVEQPDTVAETLDLG